MDWTSAEAPDFFTDWLAQQRRLHCSRCGDLVGLYTQDGEPIAVRKTLCRCGKNWRIPNGLAH